MTRFTKRNIQHFMELVKYIKIDKLSQKEFDKEMEDIYRGIFRETTSGEFVTETMPHEKENWRIYKPTQTREEVLQIIKKGDK